MDKPLFKITLNWYGENHELYIHATQGYIALSNAIHQLSKKLGTNPVSVRYHCMHKPDGYAVTQIEEEETM